MDGGIVRYSNIYCFESFPRPQPERLEAIRHLAKELHKKRESFVKKYGIGLSEFYEDFHRQKPKYPVAELRALHENLDVAVAQAYGWTDLDMSYAFHAIPSLPAKDNIRYTIDESVGIEILHRLIQLNKERAKANPDDQQKRKAQMRANAKTKDRALRKNQENEKALDTTKDQEKTKGQPTSNAQKKTKASEKANKLQKEQGSGSANAKNIGARS